MKIGLLSDTHSWLDPALRDYFRDADEIWHAGDIGNLEVSDQLEKFKPLRAVYGNIDGHELRVRFPEIQSFTIEGLKVLMIHIGGYPGRYPAKVRGLIEREKPGLFICGHSHITKVMRDKKYGNMITMNPGAAGIHGFHKMRTCLRFSVMEGKVQNLELIELGLRGALPG